MNFGDWFIRIMAGPMGKWVEHGMWIIDLDGVAYDLPIRDLRKLISGTMA